MIKIPPFLWEKQALKMKKRMEEHLNFMTDEHRRVHHFVVRELPRVGKPISAEFTAKKLDLSLARVTTILDELETSKILVWNEERNVVWAYPVTVDATPHHITFDSGERLYAA
jgi:hypothetical protein